MFPPLLHHKFPLPKYVHASHNCQSNVMCNQKNFDEEVFLNKNISAWQVELKQLAYRI